MASPARTEKLTWGFSLPSVELTDAVVSGRLSLGGSESNCIGLATALAKRGHSIHMFATRLGSDIRSTDAGVHWHTLAALESTTAAVDFDVFIALRAWTVLPAELRARWRVLWNQDVLDESRRQEALSATPRFDTMVYVSAFQRAWWQRILPERSDVGWMVRNGYDPRHVPDGVKKNPDQIIYISRPERGLKPILAMWPEVRRRNPRATLIMCRYKSFYDSEPSVAAACSAGDSAVAAVNGESGGIVLLGELGKPALYRAIAESAVMWYPGVATFAETSCVAAIEAQACGTPMVASDRGALSETAPYARLISGDAESDLAYQRASIEAVLDCIEQCRRSAPQYAYKQALGRSHVRQWTYESLSAEWESFVMECLSTVTPART